MAIRFVGVLLPLFPLSSLFVLVFVASKAAGDACTQHCDHFDKLAGNSWMNLHMWNGLQVCNVNVAGDGDCLFSTIRLGLLGKGEKEEEVTVKRLRALSAAATVGLELQNGFPSSTGKFDEHRFMMMLRLWSSWEGLSPTDVDRWQNEWSPKRILEGDTYISTSRTQLPAKSPLEKAIAVFHEISQTGNNHWGTNSDIENFENIFSLRILIIEWNERLGFKFYCTIQSDNPNLPVMIVYNRQQHFNLAGIPTLTKDAPTLNGRRQLTYQMKTIHQYEELPKEIIRNYNKHCNRHINKELWEKR